LISFAYLCKQTLNIQFPRWDIINFYGKDE
jgi:hypothetical protein